MTDRVDLAVTLELGLGALAVVGVILLAVADTAGLDGLGLALRGGAIVGALAGWAWMLRIALLDPEV